MTTFMVKKASKPASKPKETKWIYTSGTGGTGSDMEGLGVDVKRAICEEEDAYAASLPSQDASYNPYLRVIQANMLIRTGQHAMSLMEARIIKLTIAQIKENTQWDQGKPFIVAYKVSELIKFLGIQRSNGFAEISRIADSMMSRRVYFGSDDDREGITWIPYCRYIKKSHILVVELNHRLRPYIYGLNGLFTIYPYSDMLKLPSYNAMRMYEFLCSFQNIQFSKLRGSYAVPEGIDLEDNECYSEISTLRHLFHCDDKYPNTGDFLRHIIDPALKAICKNTLMRVSYRKIKDGRVITHLVFKFEDYYKYNEIPNIKEEKQCTNSELDPEG